MEGQQQTPSPTSSTHNTTTFTASNTSAVTMGQPDPAHCCHPSSTGTDTGARASADQSPRRRASPVITTLPCLARSAGMAGVPNRPRRYRTSSPAHPTTTSSICPAVVPAVVGVAGVTAHDRPDRSRTTPLAHPTTTSSMCPAPVPALVRAARDRPDRSRARARARASARPRTTMSSVLRPVDATPPRTASSSAAHDWPELRRTRAPTNPPNPGTTWSSFSPTTREAIAAAHKTLVPDTTRYPAHPQIIPSTNVADDDDDDECPTLVYTGPPPPSPATTSPHGGNVNPTVVRSSFSHAALTMEWTSLLDPNLVDPGRFRSVDMSSYHRPPSAFAAQTAAELIVTSRYVSPCRSCACGVTAMATLPKLSAMMARLSLEDPPEVGQ